MKGVFKENHGCVVSLIILILVVSFVATIGNKNKEIKLLNTKIEIKEEIIKNLEDEAKEGKKQNQVLQLPAYVYIDRGNCIHMLSTCSHIKQQGGNHIIKNNYEEVIINIPNEATTGYNYAIKRLKISETDFSKYEWYCSECVVDGYYDLLQNQTATKKPSPTATKKPSPTATTTKSEEKPKTLGWGRSNKNETDW